MHTDIEDYLSNFTEEPIAYFPNPGNAGDSLIAASTYALFEKLGIVYSLPHQENFDPRGQIIFLGGGGNMINDISQTGKLLRKVHQDGKKVVLLPHTIRKNENLLQKLGKNVDIICRERESYNYVKQHATKANILLMDDIAFTFKVSELHITFNMAMFFNELIQYSFHKVIQKKHTPPIRGILHAIHYQLFPFNLKQYALETDIHCFRTDGERTNLRIPPKNIDVSKIFTFGTESKVIAFFATYNIFKFLEKFVTIHTNRLHIAIAGALLGKNVEFYANNYFKCKAVYDFSIKDKFANVRWND